MSFYVPTSVLGIRGKTMKETKSQLIVGKPERQWTRNTSVPSGNKWCEEESVIMEGGGGWWFYVGRTEKISHKVVFAVGRTKAEGTTEA